eukprot:4145986-Pyramimonas_sp.AAC.1
MRMFRSVRRFRLQCVPNSSWASRPLPKRARLAKVLKRCEEEKHKVVVERDAYGASWNTTQLNMGNHCATLSASADLPVKHRSQYDLHSMLRTCFSFKDGESHTKRIVDIRAVACHYAASAQRESAESALASSQTKFVFVERSYDDTPIHLTFGHLAEQLRPYVKYIVPGSHRRLIGKTLA